MEDLVLHKVRISVLWIIAILVEVINLLLSVMDPAVLKEMIETGAVGGVKITPEETLLGEIIILIMVVMPFLSVTLNGKANRWSNIIVAAAFLVLWIAELIMAPGNAVKILGLIADMVFFVLIIWYAYSWPKKKE